MGFHLPGRTTLRVAIVCAALSWPALAAHSQTDTLSGVPAPGPEDAGSRLPDLGESFSDDLSPREERRIGESAMHEIRRDRDYLDDIEVSQYLNQVAGRLIQYAGAQATSVEVFAVRDPRINAFALPGGYIGVHSALVLAAQSESELASVLAHEIGHVTQRHIARSLARQKQDVWITIGTLLTAVLASRGNNPQATEAALAVGSAASAQSQLVFGRDAEREADRIGFVTLTSAGFDPGAMPIFFQRLQQATQLNESAYDVFARSHPLTIERMSDIQNRVKAAPYRQVPDSADFQLVRAKLRVLQEDSSQGVNEAIVALGAQAERTSGMARAASSYGQAVGATERRDFALATSALAAARAAFPEGHPMLSTATIRLALAMGQNDRALSLARAALVTFPQSRGVVYANAEAMQAAGSQQEAVRFLRDEIASHASEARLYQLLAGSYAALGQQAPQHRAMADYYSRSGQLQLAVEQLQMARLLKGDFYEQSAIDAQLRTLRTDLDAERKLARRFNAAGDPERSRIVPQVR